jgi:hypothetical protein
MRKLILFCAIALVAACGVAYAIGLVEVATDRPEGKYVIHVTINTAMLCHYISPADSNASPGNGMPNDNSLDAKGKITAVRPEKNEVVVSENVKNWTFQLAKDGKVFMNDRESKLSDLKAGDDAIVTFDRQGQQLLASVIRCTRK